MTSSNQDLKEIMLQKKKKTTDFMTVSALRTEIRERRKHILGSHISLFPFVCNGTEINETYVEELSISLADRTVCFWGKRTAEATSFCRRFYILAFYALASGEVGDESIDDVIQLAECLVRSRDVFVTVLRSLLPVDMVSELFNFVEAYDDSYFSATFEDAVLGAIAVLLGVLADPLNA